MTEIDEKTLRSSQNALWVTQILFALILANGLVLYRELILQPFLPEYRLATVGLVVVYLTTLLSWIDFSGTMDKAPYVFPNNWEIFRFVIDIVIVMSYAYLLFSIEYLKNDPGGNISGYILGFTLIFFLYYASGFARVMVYGYIASRRLLIFSFFIAFACLLVLYRALYLTQISKLWLNYTSVISCGVTIIIYRLVRTHIRKKNKRLKKEGLTIGVDVDGVLGNQVVGVLPIIEEKYGKRLKYEDITEWKLPVNQSNIAEIIEEALEDESYILEMPLHANARKTIDRIGRKNNIFIITARQKESEKWTKQWLFSNRVVYDKYINSRDVPKNAHSLDALVDDYLGHIREFLENTDGFAILFDQPWNHDRKVLKQWENSGRLFVTKGWNGVVNSIETIKGNVQQANNKPHIRK